MAALQFNIVENEMVFIINTPITVDADLPDTTGNEGKFLGIGDDGYLSWKVPAGSEVGVSSLEGLDGDITLEDLNLNLVDNTADADKPISTPVANALGTKASASILTTHILDVTNALNNKEPLITAGSTNQYLRGDKTLSNFNNDVRNQMSLTSLLADIPIQYLTPQVDLMSIGNNAQAIVNGTFYICRIGWNIGETLNGIFMQVGVAGSGLITNQNFACAFSYDGATATRIGITADQSTNWNSSGPKFMPFIGGQYTTTTNQGFLCFWGNGTTLPSFLRAANASFANAGFSAANPRYAVGTSGSTPATTGLTTTGPTSFTTSVCTLNSMGYVIGVY